jgi:hypothetical protein
LRHEGGCHCGRVRFAVEVDDYRAVSCNCSICRKKGILHLIVPTGRFSLLKGAEALTTYTFGTRVAQHRFCSTCGIHPFYTPRSHPDQIDVNVRCLDEELPWRQTAFDGQNWEEARPTLD